MEGRLRRPFRNDEAPVVAILSSPAASATHLTFAEQVNKGAFYTPERYVDLVGRWLVKHGIGIDCTFLEPSCGYGAFFALNRFIPDARYIGNDIDAGAVAVAKTRFPFIEIRNANALLDVGRSQYGILPGERLCIVGNPPWNDTTSQIRQGMKTARTPMDLDVSSRDLGLSSLLAYDKLAADYVAVLHPLSYLVKRPNFNAARAFFRNYRILECLVFSSQRFSATSRTSGFPVVVALYARAPGEGLRYEDVWNRVFETEEGDRFRLADRDYIDSFANKYPTEARYSPEILFYTMRDVNALARSRTFITERCPNAVDVDPAKLDYYCYVDVFKSMASTPYWMGNLNVPLVASDFPAAAPSFRRISMHNHPEVFGAAPQPSERDFSVARDYVAEAVSFKPRFSEGVLHA